MRKIVAGVISFVLLVLSFSLSASANENWPMWRGPDATGAARSGNPPITWSETENIKWKAEVPGHGLSTPIIWDNKIFFLTAMESEKEKAYKFDFVCMDRSNGEILWRKTAIETVPHEGHHNTGSFASNSAVTDGKYVWGGFGSRGVHCYDMDGNHKWSKDLGKMRIAMGFGEGASAALAGDALIVVMDHEGDSAIYALNKENGDIIWQKDRDEGTTWATPLPIEINGKLQVVTNATKLIRSYDVENGDIIWQCSGQTSNVIPSPVTGFGMVICTSGFRGNKIQAIELGHTGNLNGTDAIKWETGNRTTPYVPSPLLYGDKFYVLFDNNAVLSCYNAQTGKPYYESQNLTGAGRYYASPTGAGEKVYLASQNGVTIVISNSDTFEVLASNKLDDHFDASPVVVGDELFLKGKENLYCIAE
jgi:outer membrane protein assembly factor BamB